MRSSLPKRAHNCQKKKGGEVSSLTFCIIIEITLLTNGPTLLQGCSLFSFSPPKIAGFILVFFLFLLYPQRQFFPAFLPDLSQSRSVVGDIRKNGQNFSDLNFHKI